VKKAGIKSKALPKNYASLMKKDIKQDKKIVGMLKKGKKASKKGC
jgi:hypothetical protein